MEGLEEGCEDLVMSEKETIEFDAEIVEIGLGGLVLKVKNELMLWEVHNVFPQRSQVRVKMEKQ
jgi:hypothetical protein